MSWLKRSTKAALLSTPSEFWGWWVAEGADATAAAYEAETLRTWAEVLSKHVLAISPDLAWELGPGIDSQHVLVVTAEGNPDLRATARRWLRAAPAPTATWSYSDVRLPAPTLTWSIEFNSHSIDAASVLVGAAVASSSVNVVVYHPEFVRMNAQTRDQVSFVLLDNALGEPAVETWIGTVGSAVSPPQGGIDLARLRQVVREAEAAHTDENGQLHWAVLQGKDEDGNVLQALAQQPLRPMTAPHLDTHVGIRLQFPRVLPSGMPDEDSLVQLRAIEDHLVDRLAGNGRTVAHETCNGWRQLHLYVDSTTPAVEQLRASLGGWTDGTPELQQQYDPEWSAVQHLSG